jgi:spore coat polysaccharide biosynthesis protein SpsF
MATSTDPGDDGLADLAAAEGIAVFRGSLLNKLRRWSECAAAHGLDNLLMVDGDDLAFDPAIGRRAVTLMDAAGDGRCDMYKPPDDVVCGLFTAAYSRRAVEALAAATTGPDQDTDVIDHFIERAGLTIGIVPLDEEERGKTVRLTLDYAEDAEFFRALYARVAWDAPGRDIVRTALADGIWQVNWARQQDYLDNQAKFTKRLKQC